MGLRLIGLGTVTLALLFALLAPASAAAAATRAFFAVDTTNAQATADWYVRTFELREVNRLDEVGFDIRILASPRLVVEVIQEKPANPAAPERRLGLAKAGLSVEDFDGAVARWRAQGVRFYGGEPRVFYDKALGQHSVLLLAPDEVLVQVFGESRSAPRD